MRRERWRNEEIRMKGREEGMEERIWPGREEASKIQAKKRGREEGKKIRGLLEERASERRK